MKDLLKFILLLLAIGFVVGIVSTVNRGCNTANEMADQTVLNASRNVWSYEQFHKQYQAYEQYRLQLDEAETRLVALKADGTKSGQEYDNLVTEIAGLRNMKHRIAADYNAASQIDYQSIWKERGLPSKLE